MPLRASLTYESPASRALAIASWTAGVSVAGALAAGERDARLARPAEASAETSATAHTCTCTQRPARARCCMGRRIGQPCGEFVAEIGMVATERYLCLQVTELRAAVVAVAVEF